MSFWCIDLSLISKWRMVLVDKSQRIAIILFPSHGLVIADLKVTNHQLSALLMEVWGIEPRVLCMLSKQYTS
jgi:hypothetical protein